MIRRDFLTILAGSPFVFGLREMFAQDPGKPADAKAIPEWYSAALKRMKETRRHGVVLTVPEEAEDRARLGKALIARYHDHPMPGSVIQWTLVVICLTPELAARCVGGNLDKVNRILLDPEGRRVSADLVDMESFEDRQKFDLSIGSLFGAKWNDRLKEQAAEIEKSLSEEIRKAADDLAVVGEYSVKAATLLLKEADDILPWLVHRCLEAQSKFKDERGVMLGRVKLWDVLTNYWIAQINKEQDPCLPFGVRVEVAPSEDPCPACGLMARTMRARRFLSFYEK